MANGWRDDFTITHYTESDTYATSTDITALVESIPVFTDTGGDEVNECQMVLNARNGDFLVQGTQLADYDRIRIQGSDEDGNSYDRIFEIAPKPDSIIPSEDSTGTKVTLNLLGIEYHLQHIDYFKSHRREQPFLVVQDIGDHYNDQKGTKQPTLEDHDVVFNTSTKLGNDAPDWIVANYPWGANPKSCWDRLKEITELLSASVANGGAFDFFGLGFDTQSSDVNKIDLRFFSLGSTPTSSLETITGTNKGTGNLNTGETEGGISPPTGSIVVGWFSDFHGSLPTGFSRFVSADQTFDLRPEWDNSRLYLIDSRVRYLGNVYKRIDTDVSGSPPFTNPASDSDWQQVDEGDEFGDSIQASEWTDDKAVLWANGYTDPNSLTTPSAWATSTAYSVNDFVTQASVDYRCLEAHTSGTFATDLAAGKWVRVENVMLGSTSGDFPNRIPDSNIVIFDDDFFRTWVNYSTTNPTNIPSQYEYAGTAIYRGFRVLCNGTGAGDFSGVDKNNVDYDNSVVEYDGSEWVVKYKASSSTDTMQVVDLNAGIVYEWNNSGSSWDSLVDEDQGMDCLHPFDAVYNAEGPDPRPVADSWSTNQYDAVEMLSKWSVLDQRLLTVAPDANQNYYKKFVGFAFWFPFPLNTYNSISEAVGELYGGSTSTGQEPATFDTENMHFTPTGQRGWNKSDSESFGPTSSLDFTCKVHYSSDGADSTLLAEGDFKFRCVYYDTEDNAVSQDVIVPFNDNHAYIRINNSNMKPHRSRKPRYDGFAEFVPPKELEVLQQFNWQNLKLVVFHWLGPYDEFGRYFPEQRDADILGTLKNIPKILGEHMRFQVSNFHWTKPLVKITATVSDRVLEAEKIIDKNVINYDQANGIVYDRLEKEKFQHKGYDIDTSGTFAVRYGDSFHYANTRTVSDSDNGSNTIKVVATRIEHSITSRGFRTRLITAKRFTS